jgi:hypothetical protein
MSASLALRLRLRSCGYRIRELGGYSGNIGELAERRDEPR